MAMKYECDRCGNQTADASNIGKVSYPLMNYQKDIIPDGSSTTKDLCAFCVNQLHKFMEPLPREAKQ